MTVGILQDIIEKVRELAALGTSNQSTDQKIIKYINSYYVNDFPDDLRLLKLKDVYTFTTIQGIDVYPFDFDNWSTVQGPAYCDKTQITLLQDPQSFFNYYYSVQTRETFDYGDDTTGPFSGTTQNVPILRSYNNNPMTDTQTANVGVFPSGYPPTFAEPNISRFQNILICANTATGSLHVTDDGNGNLIGDCTTGTIDYQTGEVDNLTFTSSVPDGNDIEISYIPVTESIPFSILFYQNQFFLQPVPDKAYSIQITAYREPSKALMGTTSLTAPDLNGRPELFGWWELIAFGTAKKFYQDRLDMEGVKMMEDFLQEQISQARTRTYAQLGTRAIPTIYRGESDQQENFGNPIWGVGGLY